MNKPEFIIVHHSATTQGSVKSFRRGHLARGFRDIGYHYVIGNGTQSGDGQIEKGRQEWDSGAHCPAKKMNFRSIGICLVGNFQKQKPTAKQLQSLERLCRQLMKKYNIPYHRVLGHREVMATACPGKNVNMKQLRLRLKEGVKNVKPTKIHFGNKTLDGFIKDKKTFVELRKLCEALGLKVNFNSKKKTTELYR